MAGVVRRDGLREAVTALRDEWQRQSQGHARCMRINCSTCVTNDVAARLTAVLDAVPDVPPDPPAADRDELARWLLDYRYPKGFAWESITESQRDKFRQDAAALLSSGVLVDAEAARARALEDAADAIAREAKTHPHVVSEAHHRTWLTGMDHAARVVIALKPGDRAVSEREGGGGDG